MGIRLTCVAREFMHLKLEKSGSSHISITLIFCHMLNRRIPSVVVPLNTHSTGYLWKGKDDQGEYLVLPIERTSDLVILLEEGFFAGINALLGTAIEEYEEEEVRGEVAIEALVKWLSTTHFNQPVCRFYAEKLKVLAAKALKIRQSIYFLL